MDLIVGTTYRSYYYGRYIRILDIDQTDVDWFNLNVEWIDKDTKEVELGNLSILREEAFEWVEVNV